MKKILMDSRLKHAGMTENAHAGMTWMLMVVLKIYQNILSPFLPKSCRYYPSCSEYAKEALTRYGLRKGILLTLRRLFRCHPFCAGGYDPV